MQAMIDSCSIQMNVDMPIKDGLKRINELVTLIARDHSSALEKDVTYKKLLTFLGKGWQDRNIIRQRVQSQLLWNIVLASKEASK